MTTVWVNGCFDILHIGHIRLLKFARSFPDSKVVVGLDSDDRIKIAKGHNRPYHILEHRTEIMSSLKYVDEVVSFGTDEELTSWVRVYSPDKLLVGEHYKNKTVIGGEWAKEILFFPVVDGFSTTNILRDFEDEISNGL